MTKLARITTLICCVAAVGALAAGAGVRGGSQAHGTIFDYDASAPLGLALSKATASQGIVRQELSFRATPSLRLRSYFMHPTSRGPWPLVIWSPGAGGDRSEQLPDARAAAQKGIASLLIDTPTLSNCRDAQADLDAIVSYVVSRRRAVDLAATLPGVDAKRIAAAGFSQGAEVSGMLSGIERRISAFGLKSARAHLTGYLPIFCTALSKAQLRAYIAKLGVVDPAHWIGRSASALLMQNGRADSLSPRADALALYTAAKPPKEFRWYPVGHDLSDRIGLPPPVADRAPPTPLAERRRT
jgi:cephalosporin-C deacetylase-like acetyl esterase